MIADAVVAVPGSAPLETLLTAIHRQRLGHVARVVTAGKAPVRDQLRRAGVPLDRSPLLESVDRVILIFAAALSERGAELLLAHGAEQAWVVTRSGMWTQQRAVPNLVRTRFDELVATAESL